ncbi:hypothetical protein BYT27DRAFT_6378238 [Phlegmacium glaucopus]|nr:hypothetical protein BYT27DRAFT_6378238 [Phlegmacium glaucopus]
MRFPGWFSNFPLFRDRQQRSDGNEYPDPASIPDQWRQSQNPSGYAGPGPWHGYTYPSQANWRAYPSQPLQGQYRPHQHQTPRQPQMNQAAQPYFYPNDTSNPNPSPYHPQGRSQGNHKPGFADPNTPFNRSQPYLTPQSVQPSAQQAWTPFSNASHIPPSRDQTQKSQQSHRRASLNDHRRRSHSQRSNSRVRGASTSRATLDPAASSNAPHIQSRMLNIAMVHPLVCGHRHSLIPDQIPETEVGRPERSVWDGQNFSLPQGSKSPMMIDAVQVRSLSLDWDITLPPSFAKEIGRDGQIFNPPRHLHLPLINAKFRSEVCIKTRQDNPLTKCFLRWGCIVVESRDPNGIPPTMKQFLYDIWEYFHTSLTEEECLFFAGGDLAKLYQIVESRVENYARKGEDSPDIRERGPTRRDVLWGYTRFAGLEVCPRFADTGDLFLYLEPL